MVRDRRQRNVDTAKDNTAINVITANASNTMRSRGANNSIQLETSGTLFANIVAGRPERTPPLQTQDEPSATETENRGQGRHVKSADAKATGTRSLNEAPEQTEQLRVGEL